MDGIWVPCANGNNTMSIGYNEKTKGVPMKQSTNKSFFARTAPFENLDKIVFKRYKFV